jgi:tetratricopeptide (TPR) repeat protein
MRASGLSIFGLFLICTAAAAGPSPAPVTTDIELAKAHFRTGEIYYDRGRYADASREFEEAYRLSGRGELLYNMGKSYDGGGDAARALAAYRRFLATVEKSPDRLAVIARVDQLGKIVGRLAITSTVPGSTVKVDGAELGVTPIDPVEVNPGGHSVEVGHEGYSTWKGQVVASPGAATAVPAEPKSLVKIVRVEVPTEKTTPVYKKWWLWTIVGAVVVAGGVTAAVLATQGSDNPSGPFAQLPSVRLP